MVGTLSSSIASREKVQAVSVSSMINTSYSREQAFSFRQTNCKIKTAYDNECISWIDLREPLHTSSMSGRHDYDPIIPCKLGASNDPTAFKTQGRTVQHQFLTHALWKKKRMAMENLHVFIAKVIPVSRNWICPVAQSALAKFCAGTFEVICDFAYNYGEKT